MFRSFLTHYRSSIPHDEKLDKSIYHDFKHKGKTECQEEKKGNLRKVLLEEQGYICCYCMTRINCHHSKIEHFKPQSKYRKEQITYKNLFISCRGDTQHYEHCDTKKADRLLKHINLLKDIEATIHYKSNGEIYSSNKAIDDEINTVLNLNNTILTENRMQAYDDLINNMKAVGVSGKWSKPFIKKYISKYGNKNKHGKYSPYCSMLLFFLNKKIKRL